MRGVILAAGYGTRLDPLTRIRAKAAVPFLNRPFIEYSLEFLKKGGVQTVAVNLHHRPDTVREALLNVSASIVYSYEKEILGTGGALTRLQDFLAGHTFVVTNGKIYFEQDLDPVLDSHRNNRSVATLVLLPWQPDGAFNPVWLDEENRVVGFGREEGSKSSDVPPRLWTKACGKIRPHTFSGVHILEPEVLAWLPTGFSDTVADLYPRLLRDGLEVRGFVSRAYWCECSTLDRYLKKSMEVLARRGLSNLLEESTQAICRSVVAGRNTVIDGGSLLENCVLWDDCRVGPECKLRNVILAGGVPLPAGLSLRDCVLTPPLTEREEGWPETVVAHDNFLEWPLL